jgi:hypothetical protein
MLERELKRYSAYFRGWCQAFGEHESIYREDSGVSWLTARSQIGLVLPKTLIRPLYREVLLHDEAPTLVFGRKNFQVGSLKVEIGKKHQKQALREIRNILDSGDAVHLYLTSHLLYDKSRIITFSRKKPLPIIYKEIGTMRIRLE